MDEGLIKGSKDYRYTVSHLSRMRPGEGGAPCSSVALAWFSFGSVVRNEIRVGGADLGGRWGPVAGCRIKGGLVVFGPFFFKRA